MKITDMTAIDLTILDKSQHDRLKKDMVEIFPEIRQNYSDEKRDLIRFIMALEQVYKENKNVDKIKIEFQGAIDEHDITFNTIFRNAETKSIIEGESAKKLSICLEDIFCSDESKYDYDNHDDEDYSDPVKIIAYGMDERYFFDEISQTSREDRFSLYKKMVDFAELKSSDSIQNIINAFEKNEEISPEYKKVNFLGKEIDITVIDFKNGKFDLDVSEKSITDLRNTLELNEQFYIVNKIKKDVLKSSSGLDLTRRLITKFERVDSTDSNSNYKDYVFELMDAHGNTASSNFSFAFGKYNSSPRIEKGVAIEDIDEAVVITCFNPLYRSKFLEKWKTYEDLANKSNVDENAVSLKDLNLSNYSIKTANGHKRFIENISNVFPQIEQNYDDSKQLLVNFVLLMEKVYAEHPDIEKIGIEVDQESSVEDSRNGLYIHGMDFTLTNAETQTPLSGEAVRKVSEYIQDSYADKAYEGRSYESGNMTLAVMETDLHFPDFAYTSREDRFSLYRGMVDYNYIHNKESLDSFVDAIEQGTPIEDRYKTVNLLGENVKIKTMGISDGFLSKDATSRDVESLKKQLINIENAYIINNIKEAVLRSNLDTEDKLDISFNAKTPNNYSGYICRIEDINKNKMEVNVDLAFPKWFGFDKYSTIVKPKEDLGEALSRKFTDYSSTENLNKKVVENAEDIERNYTDVNDFIKSQRPRMKM